MRDLPSDTVDDEHARKQAALREFSDADRAYRAAFQELTSAGGLEPSSYEQLLAALERLHEAARRLAGH
jgi:hypothetical protein